MSVSRLPYPQNLQCNQNSSNAYNIATAISHWKWAVKGEFDSCLCISAHHDAIVNAKFIEIIKIVSNLTEKKEVFDFQDKHVHMLAEVIETMRHRKEEIEAHYSSQRGLCLLVTYVEKVVSSVFNLLYFGWDYCKSTEVLIEDLIRELEGEIRSKMGETSFFDLTDDELCSAVASSPHSHNLRDDFGETLFHVAISRGLIDLAEKLSDYNGDINVITQKDSFGNTPLMFAQDEPTLKCLVSKGADINASSKDDSTALWNAVCNKNHALVSILLAYGAAPNIKVQGRFPYQKALELNDTQMCIVLSKGKSSPDKSPLREQRSVDNSQIYESDDEDCDSFF